MAILRYNTWIVFSSLSINLSNLSLSINVSICQSIYSITIYIYIKGEPLHEDPEAYRLKWLSRTRSLFESKGEEACGELEEFFSTGTSNGGRPLSWCLMDILPNQAFPLHAHPTVEIVHIIKGALYERRLQGKPPINIKGCCCNSISSSSASASISASPSTATQGLSPPDLSSLSPPPTFIDGVCRAGDMLVNEVGSIHQSWTEDEGCFLLCIWGGGHLNLPPSCFPSGTTFRPLSLD